MNKVAEVTLGFWIMKICATTLGETGGDFISMTLNLGYEHSAILLLGIFLLALILQVSSKKFNPLLFWTVILSTSTAGTVISDFMDRTLHLGYLKGSEILICCLLLTLLVWFAFEKSISVFYINTKRKELFYWTAILFSNTLGTALGDCLSDNFGLGFLGGAVLIGSLILLTVLAWKFTKINTIILFWIAFVLTRPFGATFGDFLTKPFSHGGLNLGTSGSSLTLLTIFIIFMVFSNRKAKETIEKTKA
jgi:uncharacterized membrane-anchored protein